MARLQVSVHVDVDTPIAHDAYPDSSSGRPFVTVEVGKLNERTVLMFTDRAGITELINAATAARSDLVKALTAKAAAAA